MDPELYQYDGEVMAKAEELGQPGAIVIEPREDAFVFRIEGTGALAPEDIVLTALEVLGAKIGALQSHLETEKQREQQGLMQ